MTTQFRVNDCVMSSAKYLQYIQAKCPWINKFLFKELIEKDHSNKSVFVERYSLEPAVSAGENSGSEVIRAKVIYSLDKTSKREINFVIKIQKSCDDSFKEKELFLREIVVYRDILPRAEELLRSINDETKLAPKCYLPSAKITHSDEWYLIFEDLCTSGYRNHDKKIGLTFDSYKVVFSTLAKWHATTAVLFYSEPSIMETFTNSFYTEYQDILLQTVMKSVARYCRLIPALENVSKKLENLHKTILLKIKDSRTYCPNDFNCLNHNDLWINNIMFSDTANNALFIDFQLAYLGSPVLDLTKSLFKSSHNDIREKEFDDLIRHYQRELTLTLMKLGYSKKIPSLKHLKRQMKMRGIINMASGLFGTVSRYLDDINIVYGKLFACVSDEKMIDLNIFTIPEAQEKLQFLIKYFEDLGYFDS